ncbi:ATP-binding cassette domain-containing protein [Jiangella sp. DSM 45060]|uniref:ATP-binding cassette domain-containing protein n=1 Tax=Jiangella sp. DSM 45060 TaxID=1798224 RepID=UPI00087D4994|nr:ATP-binding cassette domain-containing protein [Jiangella sp. DSM 45060]SDS43076.1 peptide/nickel transport system ATP-binding protein [Jiangella sp. DSM 45060]
MIELDRLRMEFPGRGGRPPTVAVDDVSLTVEPAETLAVVGESGSGKTTLTRLLLGLLRPTSGTVRVAGTDPATCGAAELRRLRRRLQVVFQDPYSSMNPRLRVADIVAEPLVTHEPTARGRAGRERRAARVSELLEAVGLDAGAARRYPHEFSGGQRQRISIARALALNPEIVVLDEPTSALDVSVQAQVLDLLAALKREFGLTYVFVSHNLAVVSRIADRVAVMKDGAVVELGETGTLFTAPSHPYTRALIDAVPEPDPARSRLRASRAAS